MIEIGIDLSTKNFGYAILDHDKKLIIKGVINLIPNNHQNIGHNIKTIRKFFKDIAWYCKGTEFEPWDAISIGIEVGNFNRASTSQKFSFLSGIIASEFYNEFRSENIKCFNANEWFQFLELPSFTTIEREDRKNNSIAFAKSKTEVKKWNDDEADAFCVAWFLENCLDTADRKVETTFKINQYKKDVARRKKEKIKNKEKK